MKNMEIFINVLKSLIDEEDLKKFKEEVESCREASYYKLGVARDELYEYMCTEQPYDKNKLVELTNNLIEAQEEIDKELCSLISDAKRAIDAIKDYSNMSKEELIAELNRLKGDH